MTQPKDSERTKFEALTRLISKHGLLHAVKCYSDNEEHAIERLEAFAEEYAKQSTIAQSQPVAEVIVTNRPIGSSFHVTWFTPLEDGEHKLYTTPPAQLAVPEGYALVKIDEIMEQAIEYAQEKPLHDALAIQPSTNVLDEYVIGRLEQVLQVASAQDAACINKVLKEKGIEPIEPHILQIGLQGIFNHANATPLYRLKDK